ncbi:EAL domain-containing protein [Terasakiella pusilla]|uniref:bifunctional diguanylate cyclase/phosphodiesterase n=1 Tax=Terasakiella pusilla TaxID=64973 RepID=UPI003AA8EA45
MRLTTTHKIIASILLPIIVFAGGLFLRYETFWEELHQSEQNRLNLVYTTIENALEAVAKDVEFVSQNPSLIIYARTQDEERRKEFEKFLLGLSGAKKNYQQLRYIDENGIERVRVDNNRSPFAVPQASLQDKSDRYYVRETQGLRQNEIFVSKLDLNVENGEVETPYKPMIRFVSPVYVDGQQKGVFVVNYYAQEFLARMGAILGNGIQGYILNASGYWLLGPKYDLEWSFMFGKEHKFQDLFDEEWALLKEGETYFSTNHGLFHARHYFPSSLRLKETPNSFSGIYIVSRAIPTVWAGLEFKEHALELIAFALVIVVIGVAARKVILLQNAAVDREQYIQRELEEELEAAELKNTAIVDISRQGILTCSEDGTILDANPAACKMMRYGYTGLIGLNFYQYVKAGEFGDSVSHRRLDVKTPLPLDVLVKRADNSYFPAEVTVTETPHSRLESNFIVFMHDISSQKAYEEGLRKMAHYDTLTDLPNRHMLKECLDELRYEAKAKMKNFALILLGLDEFHMVNDTLGHQIGDEVLKSVAQRLQMIFPKARIVARLAGDEFVIALDILKEKDALVACEKVIEDFSHSLVVNEHEIHISMSLGVAYVFSGQEVSQDILLHADSAMHVAKGCPQNSFAVYSDKMGAENERLHDLQNRLPYALGKGEFTVFYQPLVDAKTQKTVGAEALLRWTNGELGFVSPAEFIPVAEKNGNIVEIGDWVLDEACQFALEMQETIPDFFVAINVSPIQFMAQDMAQVVASKLETYQLSPKALEIELTEGILVQDPEGARKALKDMSDLGVSVSIDDFGTGYSSLSYLSQYPFKTLKIDRSFIMGIPHDKPSRGLSAAILSMAKELNLQVIAEGTETKEQVDWLAASGAHILQGYYFDKPMPKEQFKVRYFDEGLEEVANKSSS